MAAVTSQATTDTELPELVRDSELPVIIERDLTIHPQPFTRRNQSREEKWFRETNLGRGGYGEVWLERKVEGDESLPKLRAVKTIRIPENESIFELNGGRGVRELEALAKFSQDNYKDFFVKSYGWYLAPGSLNIAMEFCHHGDLKRYLERVKTIPTQEVQEIALQILGALVSMHRNGFAHRDLKPANVLIKSRPPQDWWVKLCDFGLSKRQEGMDEVSTNRGTPYFEAPETLGFPFTGDPKRASPYFADLWCFGETLYRCHVGSATFEDKEQLFDYQCGNRQFPIEKLQQARASGLATNFIHSLMLPNPAERLDTERARRHPWLRREAERPSRPSSQVTNLHRPLRNEPGPIRVSRRPTAQSPYPAVETQLTDASGQWNTTATNSNLNLQRSVSQLRLASKAPPIVPPAIYGRPPVYNRPAPLPVYPYDGYPGYQTAGYPMSQAASQNVTASTRRRPHVIDHGADWNPSQSVQDLSRRFQRQGLTKHLDGSETDLPKKKSRRKEKKEQKVAQGPTRRATTPAPPESRQSPPKLGQTDAIPPGPDGSARQPQRTQKQEQGYPAAPKVVIRQPSLSAIGPSQGFHSRPRPPPAPGPGRYLSAPGRPDDGLWTLSPGYRNSTDPFEALRGEVDSYRRSVRNPEEDGLQPRMRAQVAQPSRPTTFRPSTVLPVTADLPQPPGEQGFLQPQYRLTQGQLRRLEREPEQRMNRKISNEAVYNGYGPNVIPPTRSGQFPPRRSVDRNARRYGSGSDAEVEPYPYISQSDSEDEVPVLYL